MCFIQIYDFVFLLIMWHYQGFIIDGKRSTIMMRLIRTHSKNEQTELKRVEPESLTSSASADGFSWVARAATRRLACGIAFGMNEALVPGLFLPIA